MGNLEITLTTLAADQHRLVIVDPQDVNVRLRWVPKSLKWLATLIPPPMGLPNYITNHLRVAAQVENIIDLLGATLPPMPAKKVSVASSALESLRACPSRIAKIRSSASDRGLHSRSFTSLAQGRSSKETNGIERGHPCGIPHGLE